MLSVKHLRGYFRYLALAFLIVVIALFFVPASAYDFGPDVVGADIYISVPHGYFDSPVSYYGGSTNIGAVSISWNDSGYVTLYSDSYVSPYYHGCGFGPYAAQIAQDGLIWRSSEYRDEKPFGNMIAPARTFYAGYGDFAFYVLSDYWSSTYQNYQSNHIVISAPTTPTVSPTPTPVQPPDITSFTVLPNYAYPYVSINVSLVGDGGTSAYITRSDVSSNVNLALQAGTTDTWVGQISFAAPGDYQVRGYLSGPGGTSSTSIVTVHIFELPDTPIISSWSVDYDQGYDIARLTATVVYPAGAVVHPDTAFWVDWGDGQSVDYYYFDSPPSYDTPVTVQMSHQYADVGTYSASFTAQNADGNTSQVFGVHIAPGPTPTPTTPEPTPTTPEPTPTTPEPTPTTPEPTITQRPFPTSDNYTNVTVPTQTQIPLQTLAPIELPTIATWVIPDVTYDRFDDPFAIFYDAIQGFKFPRLPAPQVIVDFKNGLASDAIQKMNGGFGTFFVAPVGSFFFDVSTNFSFWLSGYVTPLSTFIVNIMQFVLYPLTWVLGFLQSILAVMMPISHLMAYGVAIFPEVLLNIGLAMLSLGLLHTLLYRLFGINIFRLIQGLKK